MALVGGAIYGLVQLGGPFDAEGRQEREDREHDLRPEPVDDPDLPRHERASELRRYCDDPGQAWEDVPPYDPAKPGRLFFWDLGVARSSGLSSPMVDSSSWFHPGGAVQIAPSIDPRLSETETADTRIVACLRVTEPISFDRSCDYRGDGGAFAVGPSRSTLRYGLTGYRYGVVAYELHSGTPLSLGFVETGSGGCPNYVDPESRERLANQLTDADLLGWVGESFREGMPR